MPAKHVVTIGLGGTGKKMLDNFHDVVREEGLEEGHFQHLAIDSKGRDGGQLEHLTPEDIFNINWESQDWDRRQETYPYLRSQDKPDQQGGVGRRRPAARAMLDDKVQFDGLYNFLKTNLNYFIEEDAEGDVEEVDIWLLVSLGGGTGSGIFPIVSALLQHIIAYEISDQIGPDVKLRAIAAHPRLKDLDSAATPDAKKKHVLNSFGALAELEDILNYDGNGRPPAATINLEFTNNELSAELNAESLDLRADRFEDIFLLGVDEHRIDSERDYEQSALRIVSYFITFFAMNGEDDNFPANASYRERLTYSIDAAGLSFPHTDAATYILRDQEVDRLEFNRDTVEEKLRPRAQNVEKYLQGILRVGEQNDPEASEVGVRALFEHCKEPANKLDLDILNADVVDEEATAVGETIENPEEEQEEFGVRTRFTDVSDAIDELDDAVADQLPLSIRPEDATEEDDIPTNSPAGIVGEYLFVSALQHRLSQKARANRFEQLVDDLWMEYRDEIPDAMAYDDASAVERWDEVLHDFVLDKIDELEEDSGIIFKNDKEIQRLEDKLDEIHAEYDEAQELESHQRIVETQLEDRRNRLQRLKNGYADTAAKVPRLQDTIESQIENRKNERDNRKENLMSFHDRVDFSHVEVVNPETLKQNVNREDYRSLAIDELRRANVVSDEDIPEDHDGEDAGSLIDIDAVEERDVVKYYLQSNFSIEDLEQQDVVTVKSLRHNLRQILSNQIYERVQDRAVGNRLVTIQEHEDDDWRGTVDINRMINTSSDYDIDEIDNFSAWDVPTGVRTAVRFLYLNTDFHLDNTSEFGKLADWYEDPMVNVLEETYGDTTPDEEAVWFAYPELVEEWQNIPSYPTNEVDTAGTDD